MKNQKHNHIKHIVLMMLGCMIPIILIVVLSKTDIINLSGNFYWIMFLICPLMHIFMMKGMHKGNHGNCHSDKSDKSDEKARK